MSLPGTGATYLHSDPYFPLEKLLSKFGKDLCITEAEYAKETKVIWPNLKTKFDKIDETVPFSGLFTQKSKLVSTEGKGILIGNKNH